MTKPNTGLACFSISRATKLATFHSVLSLVHNKHKVVFKNPFSRLLLPLLIRQIIHTYIYIYVYSLIENIFIKKMWKYVCYIQLQKIVNQMLKIFYYLNSFFEDIFLYNISYTIVLTNKRNQLLQYILQYILR